MPLTFITGPVRSGKSRFAERLASEAGGEVTYLATARVDPLDTEWSARLAHHAARRPGHWRLIETAQPHGPTLAQVARSAGAAQTLLVDSFGTWLADRMARRYESDGPEARIDADALEDEANDAVRALVESAAFTVVVGEEVGWGLVPPYPSGRVFRDVLGRAQQRLAAGAARAFLVIAGFALDLHAHGRPVGDDERT